MVQVRAASIYIEDRDFAEAEAVEVDEGYCISERSRHRRRYFSERERRHAKLQDRCTSCIRKEQRQQDGKKWPVVPRWQQLYEGNFREWLNIIDWMLRKLGIWTGSGNSRTEFSSTRAEHIAINESWTVSVLLMHVDPYCLTRLHIPPAISSFELLSKLAIAASPFRFRDLPVELRLRIFEYMVPVGEEYNELVNINYEHPTEHDVGSWVSVKPARLATVRRLCGVSQEFREEVSKIHYSSNRFISETYNAVGPDVVQEWANVMGERNLRHLRDFKVTFGYYKDLFDTFHVTYDTENGLEVKIRDDDSDYDPHDARASKHLAMIKARKEVAGSESTGVLEFFTASQDSMRTILYRYCLYTEEDYEMGRTDIGPNERNAHQVAYGDCYLDCPW